MESRWCMSFLLVVGGPRCCWSFFDCFLPVLMFCWDTHFCGAFLWCFFNSSLLSLSIQQMVLLYRISIWPPPLWCYVFNLWRRYCPVWVVLIYTVVLIDTFSCLCNSTSRNGIRLLSSTSIVNFMDSSRVLRCFWFQTYNFVYLVAITNKKMYLCYLCIYVWNDVIK